MRVRLSPALANPHTGGCGYLVSNLPHEPLGAVAQPYPATTCLALMYTSRCWGLLGVTLQSPTTPASSLGFSLCWHRLWSSLSNPTSPPALRHTHRARLNPGVRSFSWVSNIGTGIQAPGMESGGCTLWESSLLSRTAASGTVPYLAGMCWAPVTPVSETPKLAERENKIN